MNWIRVIYLFILHCNGLAFNVELLCVVVWHGCIHNNHIFTLGIPHRSEIQLQDLQQKCLCDKGNKAQF